MDVIDCPNGDPREIILESIPSPSSSLIDLTPASFTDICEGAMCGSRGFSCFNSAAGAAFALQSQHSTVSAIPATLGESCVASRYDTGVAIDPFSPVLARNVPGVSDDTHCALLLASIRWLRVSRKAMEW